MRVFGIGIRKALIDELKVWFDLESMPDDSTGDPEDVLAYLDFGKHNILLVDLDYHGITNSAVSYIRKCRPQLVFVGIANETLAEAWSERRAEFLNSGGDDLIRKKINPVELDASVRAIVRRVLGVSEHAYEFVIGAASIHFNTRTRALRVNHVPVNITPAEFKLLEVLAQRTGMPKSREDLATIVGIGNDLDRNVDSHIKRLRKKMGSVHSHAEGLIQTVRGLGYKIPLPDEVYAPKRYIKVA